MGPKRAVLKNGFLPLNSLACHLCKKQLILYGIVKNKLQIGHASLKSSFLLSIYTKWNVVLTSQLVGVG